MIAPFYDLVMIPGVLMVFQGEYFRDMTQSDPKPGDAVLFPMLKAEKNREEMTPDDFYPIGITGKVESVDKEGNVAVRLGSRITITSLTVTGDQISLEGNERPETDDLSAEEEQKSFGEMKQALLAFTEDKQWGLLVRGYIRQWKNSADMITSLSRQLNISNDEKYQILAEDSRKARQEKIEHVFYEFLELARLSNEAQTAQQESNEKIYREDAIKKQISYLQQQLDEMHPENVTDVRRFEKKIEESGMNKTARAEADKILNRMKQEGENSHEYGSLYEYLDFVTSLSWKKGQAEAIDLDEAEKVLDEDHFGMKKVKQRILQQIAVMNLNRRQSGSILLFVGAPGTGKTSIGQSIARALKRSYVRVSLGGVRDEADIRGHRRTYIGAMPGRIMEGMKQAGTTNPVMVLDEVDKLAHDALGDPASALLEVLDPEQNNTFTDHYMNVPYDLSDVLFVCTANTTDTIPEPLLNRMEIIPFPGYTATDKFQIARRHLLPKAMKTMGIRAQNLKVTDAALRVIISDYTMESGVRGLKKCLDTLCRAAAVKLVRGEQKSLTISPKRLPKLLDMKPIRHEVILRDPQPGVVTGLAWTQAGGEILFIEALFTKGSGKTIITGQLGDVMKESAQIAISLSKALFPDLEKKFEDNDLHIHVPAGAVPKDGPSAGVTMTTAICSLLTGRSVEPTVAMTGEVSLRGGVMPIGGLPEKLMAAQRAGVKTVFIPEENVDDLDEVADEVKSKLTIVPVKTVKDVLKKTGVMLPEKPQPEKTQAEKTRPEKPQPEKNQLEKPQAEKTQPEKPQPEKAQSKKTQPESGEKSGATEQR